MLNTRNIWILSDTKKQQQTVSTLLRKKETARKSQTSLSIPTLLTENKKQKDDKYESR